MNGTHDDGLPLDNDSFDSVEQQRAMNDLRPTTQEYPGGGNGGPSAGDIIRSADKIAQVVAVVGSKIPKREEQKQTE